MTCIWFEFQVVQLTFHLFWTANVLILESLSCRICDTLSVIYCTQCTEALQLPEHTTCHSPCASSSEMYPRVVQIYETLRGTCISDCACVFSAAAQVAVTSIMLSWLFPESWFWLLCLCWISLFGLKFFMAGQQEIQELLFFPCCCFNMCYCLTWGR